jgi:hypothetical protein
LIKILQRKKSDDAGSDKFLLPVGRESKVAMAWTMTSYHGLDDVPVDPPGTLVGLYGDCVVVDKSSAQSRRRVYFQ